MFIQVLSRVCCTLKKLRICPNQKILQTEPPEKLFEKSRRRKRWKEG